MEIDRILIQYKFEMTFVLWIAWLTYSMYSSWLAIPLTALLCCPLVYVIKTLKLQKEQSEIMDAMKNIFEQLAMETSSGLHFDNAMIQVIQSHYRNLSKHHPLHQTLSKANQRCLYRLMDLKALLEIVEVLKMKEVGDMIHLIDVSLRTGQQMTETQIKMSQMISEAIHQQENVHQILARKRMELWIMSFVPGVALILVRLTSPEYLHALNQTISGYFLVSMAILLMNLAIVMFTWNQNNILRSTL